MGRYADALVEQAVEQAEDLINWAERGGASAYFNELGWPYHHSEQDAMKWNRLGREVLKLCNRRNVPVVCWSDNGTPDYPFAPIQPTVQWGDLSVTQRSARPWMDFWRGARQRSSGLYLGQGHQNSVWGNPSTTASSGGEHKQYFSNVNRGTLNTDYAWNTAADMTYLAARNVPCVWASFRWERMQPTPGGALDSTYLAGLVGVVDAAIAANLNVVVQCFNKGAYYIDNGGSPSHGVRHRIGNGADGATITDAVFADLWERLATELSGKGSRFLGYAIMNEPSTGSRALWEASSQAAVDAIEAIDATRNVYVSVLTWQPIQSVAAAHTAGPWITGTLASAGKIKYGHSLYFQDGQYTETYDEVLADPASGWSFYDDFNRADGAISAPTIGRPTWLTSTVEIKSNQLATSGTSATSDGEANIVTAVNSYRLQVMMATWDTTTASREHWVHFRNSFNATNDKWRFGLSGSTWYLQNYQASGSPTTVASNKTTTDAPIASNQLVEVVNNGPKIECYVGGILVYETWSSYLQGSSMVGIGLTNAPNARIDWIGTKPIHNSMGALS